jgi:RHS repeat-associated protein
MEMKAGRSALVLISRLTLLLVLVLSPILPPLALADDASTTTTATASFAPGPLDFAVFATGTGCGAIKLSGNTSIDSYDSSAGTYAQTKQLNQGIVGVDGNIDLTGNATIYGPVFALNTTVGQCQNGIPGITLSGRAAAIGGYIQLSAPPTFISVPIIPPGTTDVRITENMALPPGNYRNITVSGHTTLTLSPGTYNINSISVTGQSVVTFTPPGRVIINVAGNNAAQPIQFSGGEIDNPTGIPLNFQLIYGGTSPVALSGGSNSHAILYAPSAPVSITGGSDWFGAMVVGTLDDSGGVDIHYDRSLAVAPTITALVSPVPNVAGWNNSNVTVTFTCSDPVFGIASCSPPVQITTEGANQLVTGTAVNRAGFSATTTVTINLDKTPPVITRTVMPPPNVTGWNSSNVTVVFTCTDALSGIASCPLPVVVSADGANQVVTGTAVDVAGNTAVAMATINLDKTPPTITATITPAANSAGWNNSNVTVSFACADALSGVATCPGPVQVTTEGARQVVSATAVDKAGNTATVSATVNLDKTPPTLSITSPVSGAVVPLPSVTVTGNVSDSLSGVASVSCQGNAATISGSSFTCVVPIVAGPNTITVQATDAAGNSQQASVAIQGGVPVILSATPNSGQQGQQNESVAITGQFTHFVQGTTGVSFGAGITVVSLTVTSATTATAVINIDLAAAVGPRTVTVTTGTEVASLSSGFIVTAAVNQPPVVSAGPNQTISLTSGEVQFTEYPLPTSGAIPEEITTGPDGNLWFGETTSNKIGRITTAGAITEFPIPTSGGYPEDITAGPDGNLWFTEYRGNKIGRITAAGVFTEFPVPTSNSFPFGITAGPDGNLWFTERFANQIAKITPVGVITELPVPTSGSQPTFITTGPDGSLWFSEGVGNKIGRITTGGVITEFPLPASGSEPDKITTGPDGNLWFTEASGNRIGRITTAGLITEFLIPTSGSQPRGIAPGPDGNLWFAENATDKIGRITTTGVITEFATGLTPGSVEIITGPDGNLWFTVEVGNGIVKASLGVFPSPANTTLTGSITDDGLPAGATLSTTWSETSGPNPVSFGNPTATFPDVAGQANPVTTSATFSAPGTYTLGLTGSDSQLSSSANVTITVNPPQVPTILSVSPNTGQQGQQNLAVNIISQFTHLVQGTTTASFGSGITVVSLTVNSATTATAALNIDPAAAVDPRRVTLTTGTEMATLGNAFTVQPNSNQPPRVSAGCDLTVSLPLAQVTFAEYLLPAVSSGPNGITVGPDCNLWFAERSSNKIGRISTTGVITEFLVLTPSSEPNEVVTGPDGNLWFTEYTGLKIGRMTPAGAFTEFPVPTTNSFPSGIAGGPDGNLWFTESGVQSGDQGPIGGNKIGRITPAGVITEFAIPTANSAPYEITVGADGNLWFTEARGNNIGRITPAGAITEFPVPTSNSGLLGITAGPDGNLWFTEYAPTGNKIGRITTTGTITEFPIPTIGSQPNAITLGPDGNLWFTEYVGQKIGRITPTGVFTEFIPPTSSSGPAEIIRGPDGNLWFTELSGNKIGRANAGIFLSGRVTDDGQPLGATLTTTWSETSGPSPVSFGTPTATFPDVAGQANPVSTSATFGAPGTYTLTLTGSDSQLSRSSSVTITVNPPSSPIITNVTPNNGQQGQQILSVNITGQLTHWVQGTTTASFGSGITVASLTVNSPTTAIAVLNIDSAALVGSRDVSLTTGTEVATLPSGFSVTSSGPAITQISPNTGQQGQQNLSVTITGLLTHFVQGTTTASFGAGVTVVSLTVNSATSATAILNIDSTAATGGRSVTLTTNTEVVTLANGFTVSPGTPVIVSVNPNTGQQGQILSVVVTGLFTHFAQGTTIADFGPGITVSNIAVASTTSLTAQLNIAPNTPVCGARAVTVTTGTEVATLNNAFTVTTNAGIGSAVQIPVGTYPLGVVFDGINIWVANDLSDNVTKIRPSDGSVLGTFAAGSSPWGIVFDGANIWVTNNGTNTVTKLRASDGVILGTFAVGTYPEGLAFDGANIWVANRFSNSVTKLRTSDGMVLGTFPVGMAPDNVIFDGNNIWAVSDTQPASVTKLRSSDGTVLGTFGLGSGTFGLAFDGSNIWVDNYFNNSVTELRAADGGLVRTLPVGSLPTGLAFDGANVWVANGGENSVTKIQACDGTVLGAASVGTRPWGVASDGGNIWVANSYSNTVSKLGIVPQASTPTLVLLNPNIGQQGQQNLSVAITGQFTHFVQGTTTASFGAGITVASLTVNGTTTATAVINIDPAAALGASTVTLTTNGEVASFVNGFTISATLAITQISPNTALQGQQNVSVAITGQFTHFLQGTTTASFGAGITIASLTVNSPTTATAVLNIDPAAATGARNVTITTGSEVASLVNGFTVNAAGSQPPVVNAGPDQNLSMPTTYSYTFTSLGSLGGRTAAYAINEAGDIVGSSITAGGNLHAFVWRAGQMTDLGTLGGAQSWADGINNNGQIVGQAQASDGSWHAFLYESGQMQDLGPPGPFPAQVKINDSGEVVGRTSNGSGWFLYKSGLVQYPTGGGSFWAEDIGSDGSVVGNDLNENVSLWQSGTFTLLPGGPGQVFSMNGIDHAVGYIVSGNFPVLWANGSYTALSTSSGNAGFVDDFDQVLAGDSGGAFVWRNGNKVYISTLIPTSSSLQQIQPYGSTYKGQIIGDGTLQSGQEVGFVLNPKPYELVGQLTGSATDASLPPGSVLTYQWTQVSGPIAAAFDTANAAATAVHISTPGTYTFRLTASYLSLSAFADTHVVVTAANLPPVVNAGPSQNSVNGSTVLQGVVTDDGNPVGAVLAYVWKKVSGPGSVQFSDPHILTPVATFTLPGTYILRLAASDTQFTSTADVQIVVASGIATIVQVSPNTAFQGQSTSVTITGQSTHFSQGVTTASFGAGITVASLTVTSATSASALLNIDPAAITGIRDVTLTTGTEVASLLGGFAVSASAGVPIITTVSPNSGQQGQGGPVGIVGLNTHFAQGTTQVSFGPGITVSNITVTCPTCLTAQLQISPTAVPGPVTVTVTTGSEVASLANGFTIQPGTPIIASFGPTSAQQGQTFTLTVNGQFTHFTQGTTQVSLGAGATVSNISVSSATSLTAQIAIDPAASVGTRTLTVTTGTEVVSVANVFNVLAATPIIFSLNPGGGQQGQQNLSVAITGLATHFVQGTSQATFGAGVTVVSLTVTSATSATAVLNIDPAAALGARTVTMTTGAEVASFANGFTIIAGTPAITTVNPSAGQQGQQNLSVNITSQFTHFVQGTTTANFGAGIAVASLTINSPTSATAIININSSAPVSSRDVTLTTGSEIATLLSGFNVTSSSPAVTQVSPNTGAQGQQNLQITITGQSTHFVQGTTTANFGAGITVASLTVNSPTMSTVVLNIDPAATPGPRNVTFTTGSEVAALSNGFTITNGTPVITQISPNSGPQGIQNLSVQITGQFTHFAQGTTQVSFGTGGVTVNSVSVTNAGSLTANISIALNQTAGSLTVTVTTGAEIVSLQSGFLVQPAVNQPPVITIAPTWSDTLPNLLTITYGVADDGLPVGGALTVSWQTVSGPGNVGFQNQTLTCISCPPPGIPGPVNTAGSITVSFDQPGTYVLQIGATDTQLTTTQNVTVTVSGTVGQPPTVSITSPADGTEVTAAVNVIGSVGSSSLSNWVLEYQPPNDSSFHTLATGTTPVTNGTLGTFDPTLLVNGIAYIRLTATDTSNQSTTTGPISLVLTRNQKVGNFTVSFNDLTVPVAGLPIQIVRTYDSRNRFTSGIDFSYGWTLDINAARLAESVALGDQWTETSTGGAFPNYCVQPLKAHVVTLTLQDGTTYQFAPTLNPSCQSLVPILEQQVTITFSPMGATPPNAVLALVGNSQPYVVGSVPGPVTLTDADLITTFDPDQYLLTLPDGRTLQISMQSGLQKMTDLNGNTLTVSSSGITSSTGKSVTFTRNAARLITQITDPAGHTINYSYDPLTGNLTSVTDQSGNTTTFTYDPSHFLLTIVDPRGVQPIRNVYDNSGRLIQHVDAFGNVINYTNNLSANQEVVTDRLGNVTVNNYDADGNIVQVTDALGGVTNRTYDARDNLRTETNALNKTRTYTYDANNNRLTESDPLGNTTTYTYNARNQVLTITDALGRVTTNTYDANGNLLSTKDAAANTTTYVYNAQGLRTSMTDPLGGVSSYQYDAFGNFTQQTDPLGHITTYTYDANGNKLTETKTRTGASGLETLVISYQYDASNRLIKTTYADGSTTQIQYNAIGKQGVTIDQLGRQTSYQYDLMGRLTQTTYPDATTESSTYDAEGDRITSTDRGGRTTSYLYDALKRLTKTTYADTAATSTAYDAIGEVTGVTDPRGNVTQYQYDDAGRRVKVIDALTHSTSFAYDQVGNQLSMTDANSNTTQYQYDALNRRIKTIYADSTSDGVAYDALGRTISKTDQAGLITQFQYDADGRLIQVTDAAHQLTGYAYDEIGERISQTDANNHTTSFAYDKLGRRNKRTLPLGMSETMTYDAAGNLISKIDFNGRTTSYTYDQNNRLTSKTPDPSFSAPTITFTYTATGQRQNMVDDSGTTLYSYDVRDRLLSKATPEGTLTYTYDLAGNLGSIRSSNTNGTSVNYAFDVLNRLSVVTDDRLTSGTTNYSYDPVGNLAGYLYPNGVQHTYTYNTLNRLTNLAVAKGAAASLASYAYTLGAAGNRTAVVELGGRQVNYTYDALYRLTNETIAGGSVNGSVGYTYDAVGNRLMRTSTVAPVPAATYSYDANDRLTTDTYDADGNTTASGANTYAYDFENHLTSQNSGSVAIIYDGDGNRVSKSAGGVTTKYLVDDRNLTGYAQVLEEISGGTVQRVYTYGLSRISQSQASGTSFYGYDGLGNVRMLTDNAGVLTDRYDYDAFGNVISQGGTTSNVYLYSGEQNDPNLGLYYLRARYVSQSSGRFWTMDPLNGRPNFPASLHKYLYAGADPIDRSDPSGKQIADSISLSLAGAINEVLSTITVPNFLTALTVAASTVLVAEGLTTIEQVRQATRVETQRIDDARAKAKQAVEESGDPDQRVLFHYTLSRERALAIFTSGTLLAGPASGLFPSGAYATDIAGWLPVELMRRSQLVTYIFGRYTPANYADTAWFVAFQEVLPKFKFTKLAFAIYYYPGAADIIPLVISQNLLGE